MATTYSLKFEPSQYFLKIIFLYGTTEIDTYTFSAADDIDESVDNCADYFHDSLDDTDFSLSSIQWNNIRKKLKGAFEDFIKNSSALPKQPRTQQPGAVLWRNESQRNSTPMTNLLVHQILENRCAFSAYVIETCFEKIASDEHYLIPGSDRVPKNITFIDNRGSRYFAPIEDIVVFHQSLINQLDNQTKGNIGIAFTTSRCDYGFLLLLGGIRQSTNDQNVRFYKGSEGTVYSAGMVPVVQYDFERCSITADDVSPVADNLLPALSYYCSQWMDLAFNQESKRDVIDLPLLREHCEEFRMLLSDEATMVLPIVGRAYSLKSISLIVADEYDATKKYSYLEGRVSLISDSDKKSFLNTLLDYGIELQQDRSLCVLNMVDLSSRDVQTIKNTILGSDVVRCYIMTNTEGERTRLKRIISGIENAISGKTINQHLVESVCKGDVSSDIPDWLSSNVYIPNETNIEHLRDTYPRLKNNHEQLVAIDKIEQMEENDIDFLLVQGPPGTGKTELILALASELSKMKHRVLITSNVHVACDNVVDRFKNNRDVVLKRYTTIRGDQFEKEFIANQRAYIENQVLAGFQYIDDNEEIHTLKSQSDYDALNEYRAKLLEEKKALLEKSKAYDEQLREYTVLISKLDSLRNQIKENHSSLRVELLKSIKISALILLTRRNLIEVQTMEADLQRKLEDQQDTIGRIKEQEDEHLKRIKELYARDKELDDRIGDNNDIILKNEKDIPELERKIADNYENISRIERIDIAEVITHVLRSVEESCALDAEYSSCLGQALPEIELLSEINKILRSDSGFWNGDSSIAVSSFESFYFLAKREMERLEKYIETDVLNSLDEIYDYLKAPDSKKKWMGRLPFVKLNNNNQSYYLSKISALDKNLKKFQYYTKSYVTNLVKENYSDLEKQTNITNLNEQNAVIEERIRTCREQIDECNRNISILREEIEENRLEKERESDLIWKCQQKNKEESAKCEDIHKDAVEYGREIQELKDRQKQYQEEVSILRERETLLAKEAESKSIELAELEKEMSETYRIKREIIENRDLFRNKISIELGDVEKKIDAAESVWDLFETKVRSFESDGWSKDDALSTVFSYVSELDDIVNCDDNTVSNYFMGKGNTFDRMFKPNDTASASGSLISMTTSQVASLLNNTSRQELSFDYAIVDEASKCRMEDLIISLPRVKHFVLIGDFMQLDPMYTAYQKLDLRVKQQFLPDQWTYLNKSPFSSLLAQFVQYNEVNRIDSFDDNPYVAVMKRQYRMNKGIFEIIEPIYSIHKGFELIDEKKQTSNDLKCVEILGAENQYGQNGDGLEKSTSFYNSKEADAIIEFLDEFYQHRSEYPNIKSIGIITGYRDQEKYIWNKVRPILLRQVDQQEDTNQKRKVLRELQVGTFDRFQGREFDLVIVSLVRTRAFGFTNDVRRMNVAFSRAKKHLIVFGNFEALYKISQENNQVPREDLSDEEREEQAFVKKTLIPKLHSLRDRGSDYISSKDRTNSLLDFIKEE